MSSQKMNDKDFQKLLDVAARHTAKGQALSSKISVECIRRYGVHYSDVDADGIIDILDYIGQAGFPLADFEAEMLSSGAKRIDI